MVEEDSVGDVKTVRFPVIDGVPMRGNLADAIRTAWVERRAFVLWRRCRAKHLRRTGLVEAYRNARAVRIIPHGLQESKRAQAGYISSVFRLVERDAHVRLRTEVVDLVWADFFEHSPQHRAIRQVTEVQVQGRLWNVRVRIQVLDALGIEHGRSTNYPVHLVAFREQQLSQIRSV